MNCNRSSRPGVDENFEECRDGMHTTNCLFLANDVNTLGFDLNPNATLTEVFNILFNRILEQDRTINYLTNKIDDFTHE